jgi:hypothetical protein
MLRNYGTLVTKPKPPYMNRVTCPDGRKNSLTVFLDQLECLHFGVIDYRLERDLDPSLRIGLESVEDFLKYSVLARLPENIELPSNALPPM